jgi:hypothetical protein
VRNDLVGSPRGDVARVFYFGGRRKRITQSRENKREKKEKDLSQRKRRGDAEGAEKRREEKADSSLRSE